MATKADSSHRDYKHIELRDKADLSEVKKTQSREKNSPMRTVNIKKKDTSYSNNNTI